MKKIILLIVSCMLLSGCTSLVEFSEEDNELRATEYGADVHGTNIVVGGAGIVGGCRVVQSGKVDACVKYTGTTCTVESNSCIDSE